MQTFGENSMCRGAQHTPCQTQILRLVKAPAILAGSGNGGTCEQWQSCRAWASCGDVLCSIHRRIVNETAASGAYKRNTLIRVDPIAFKHASCKFSIFNMAMAGSPDGQLRARIDNYETVNSTKLVRMDDGLTVLGALSKYVLTSAASGGAPSGGSSPGSGGSGSP